MKNLNVTIICKATYNSIIQVPDDYTEAQAIEYAKQHIAEIPINELEYVKGSDVLDEDNCSFDDNDYELSPIEKKAIDVWDYFDNTLIKLGYSVRCVTKNDQDEEIEALGKVCSPLGSTAYKKDKFSPVIKLYIQSDYKYMSISVIDRNGSNIIEGRNIGHYVLTEVEIENMQKALDYVIKKYSKYCTGNFVPHELTEEKIEF